MSKRECLIAEVREQKRILAGLIDRLAAKGGFDHGDCYTFEVTTKQVEKSLRRIHNLLAEDHLKHLSQTQYCS